MRIAQITCVFPPYVGGIGQVAFNYAKYLSVNHQVTVFTPQYSQQQQPTVIPGVDVRLIKPVFSLGNAALLPNISKLIKNFDIVHLHYPFFGAHEFIPKLTSGKLVATYHMVATAPGVKGWFFKQDMKWSDKKLSRVVDTWLVSSEDYASAVVRRRLGGKAKIEVLPFCVDSVFTPGEPSPEFVRKFNLRTSIPTLLFVGGLDRAHYFKGLSLLLKALSGLRDLDWQLLIVGDGDLKVDYIKEAGLLSIDNRVVFAGRLSDGDLQSAYRSASCLVLPSVNQAEAFGLVVAEAMACGVAVLASDLPGVRSLITPGHTGDIFTVRDVDAMWDKLKFVISNPQIVKNWGREANKIAEQEWRWPGLIDKLERVYKGI